MICDGCYIGAGARVESSVLSPGVVVRPGAVVRESILLTDCYVESGAVIERAVLDRHVVAKANCKIGWGVADPKITIALVGKNSTVPEGCVVEPNGQIGTDVALSDFEENIVRAGQFVQTRRLPNEL
jgi:glucose-1-phosphate adenylyltransferase